MDAKDVSESLGVCLEYLVNIFPAEAKKLMHAANPDFYDLAPKPKDPGQQIFAMTHGPHGKGKGKICPRDGREDCSFVDALQERSKGKATHFLSWTWSYTVEELRSALDNWHKNRDEGVYMSDTHVWICFFCNNQFRMLEQQSQMATTGLEDVFKQRILNAGHVLVMMNTYDKPSYLNRAWCVFESYVAVANKVDVQVVLPAAAAADFRKVLLHDGMCQFQSSLRSVDIMSCKASDPNDLAVIKNLITKTFTARAVNQKVQELMIDWAGREAKSAMLDALAGPPLSPPPTAPDAAVQPAETLSEMLGVGMQYIMSEFPLEAERATGTANPRFSELARHVCYGPTARGFGKVCPRDGRMNCSYVDALPPQHKGRATHFVSWKWSYSLDDVCSSLQTWRLQNRTVDPASTYLWMCFFTNNQFRVMDSMDSMDPSARLKQHLQHIGRALVMFDSFCKPIFVERAWCIFEMAHFLKGNLTVEFTVPARVLTEGKQMPVEQLMSQVQALDSSNCTAPLRDDEDYVRKFVNEVCGFDAVNQEIRLGLQRCFVQSLALQGQ